jgi:hypothetical protein
MSKAQVSVEAITIVGILLVIFSIMSYVALVRQEDVRKTNVFLEYRLECSRIYNEVVNVYNMGDGAISDFELKKNVTFLGGQKRAYMGGHYCILCCNVTSGNLTSFSFCSGDVKIKNADNRINITSNCIASEEIICQDAATNGICNDIDTVYGEGYRQDCCDEHDVCC